MEKETRKYHPAIARALGTIASISLLAAGAALGAGTEIMLRGKVVDADDEPIREARVVLTRVDETANQTADETADETAGEAGEPWREILETDRKGRFSHFLIQGERKLTIRVEKDGYRTTERDVQPIVLADDNERRRGLGRGSDAGSYRVEIVLEPAVVTVDVSEGELDPESLDPDLRRATALRLFNEGVAAAREGRTENAESSLRRSLKIMPDLVPARVTLGKVLFDAGRFDQAAEAFAAAADLAPPTAEVLELTYHAARRAGREEQALAALDELWQRQPARAQDEMFELATIYRDRGELDLAKQAVEKVIEFRPRDSATRYFYGRLLLTLDDVEGAVEQFRLFLDIDPDSPRAEAVRDKLEELGGGE